MDGFSYKQGVLHAEGVNLDSLAEKLGTPLFVYSLSTLASHLQNMRHAFFLIDPLICFSVKSCSNLSILKFLVERGAGLDVVSGGEIYRALLAGARPESIVFAGVGKSAEEIRYALESGVYQFNVESEGELARIDAIAGQRGCRARVSIRINPDVADRDTPQKTSTGGRQTKFGIPVTRSARLYAKGLYSNVDVVGIHAHIGSPIHDSASYLACIDVIETLLDEVEQAGGTVDTINIGGGFPAIYEASHSDSISLQEMGSVISHRLLGLKARGLRFVIEPGRSISANAGVLLTGVEYIKDGWDRQIVIVDAGMNILLRPTLYGAHHAMWPIRYDHFNGHWTHATNPSQPRPDGALSPVDVVGPICETGDFLALSRPLPTLSEHDTLAIFSAGAYAMSMASQYNSKARPAEVLIMGEHYQVVRQRERYEDLVAREMDGIETVKSDAKSLKLVK